MTPVFSFSSGFCVPDAYRTSLDTAQIPHIRPGRFGKISSGIGVQLTPSCVFRRRWSGVIAPTHPSVGPEKLMHLR